MCATSRTRDDPHEPSDEVASPSLRPGPAGRARDSVTDSEASIHTSRCENRIRPLLRLQTDADPRTDAATA